MRFQNNAHYVKNKTDMCMLYSTVYSRNGNCIFVSTVLYTLYIVQYIVLIWMTIPEIYRLVGNACCPDLSPSPAHM